MSDSDTSSHAARGYQKREAQELARVANATLDSRGRFEALPVGDTAWYLVVELDALGNPLRSISWWTIEIAQSDRPTPVESDFN